MCYPIDSIQKEIDREAEDLLKREMPKSWIFSNLDQREDYGLDGKIQVINDTRGVYSNFGIQLKGTKDKKNISNKHIRTYLKAKTLNYYKNISLTLLIVCDLNEEICYYQYVDEIIEDLFGNESYLENPNRRIPIYISKENILNSDFDITSALDAYATVYSDLRQKNSINKNYSRLINKVPLNSTKLERYINITETNFNFQKDYVYVDSFIPNKFDFSISCLIKFNLGNTDNVLITPDEKFILTRLFTGYKSKPDSLSRKWVIGPVDDGIIIQIGNVRLTVPIEVIIDLSKALDMLFDEYTNRLINVEKEINACSFEVSKKYSNGYKLIKIKRYVWFLMHEFAEKHEKEKKQGKWDIFGYDRHSLRVFFQDKEYFYGGNLVVSPERDNLYDDYKTDDTRITLVWNSIPCDKYDRNELEKKIVLVNEAYSWFVNEFIPKVIYEHEKKIHKSTFLERLFKKEKTLDDFLKEYNPENYIARSYKEVEESEIKDQLKNEIQDLQSFYYITENIYVNIEDLIVLYEGLIFLLNNSKFSDDLNYLHGNLNDINVGSELTKENLVKGILLKIDSLKKGTTNSFRIDLILRCYVTLFDDNMKFLNDTQIIQLQTYLKNIKQMYKKLKIIDRRLEYIM